MGRKWIEVVEVEEKVGSDVCEVEVWMNVDGRVGVVGKNVVGEVLLKGCGKLREILEVDG